MESVGLMDILLCLSIRGICDYIDSYKDKVWQRYTTVTAAVYARELFEMLSVIGSYTSIVFMADSCKNTY